MFCPAIIRECEGEGCRDWDKANGRCFSESSRQQLNEIVSLYAESLNLWKMSQIWDKVHVNLVLMNPMVDEEVKEVLRKAVEAPSTEIAEQLLKDAGLI